MSLIEFLKLNSLRSRLMLLVALAIIPSILMTFYTGWKGRQHAVQISQENLQRLTSLAAVNEAESLTQAQQLLTGLANVPELLGSAEQCTELMQSTLRRYPGYANLGLIQMNGDVTCSAVHSPRQVNLADREHFQRAVAERRFIAGNYVFGRVIQQHTINLTYPVINAEGAVVAVVFAALTLPELDKFIQGIDLPEGSVLITTDAEGTIISRRPDPESWFGEKIHQDLWHAMNRSLLTPVEVIGADGVRRLHAFARVGSHDLSNFTVTIGIPSEDIVESAWRDQAVLLVVLAAITALALLATWLIGNFMIVARVRKLVSTAQDIASGKLEARTGIHYREGEEFSTLARALDEMAQALQRKEAERDRAEEELRVADRRKDEFLAMLAHELRNPLAPIRTAADVLRLTHQEEPRIRQTSEIIGRQIDHMTGLVNDLLDVSRVTRGLVTLSREALDLRSIITAAIEQSRSIIEEHRHTLKVDLPDDVALVFGDRMRLIQIVTNLLNNAAKYTPPGGCIEIGIRAADTEWAIGVKDNGVGINADLLQRVFDLFSQAERTPDRSQGGLGLGLALVRSLVELHGGTVSAESAGSGQGSEFTVRLPRLYGFTGVLEDAAGDPVEVQEAGRPLRLLVVDDNVDAADTTAALLRGAGHEVIVAYDAHQALEQVRQYHPEALLLDIGLPDMDGYELAQRLRQQEGLGDATLIALTGYGRAEDRERSREAGFDHHLVKPAHPVLLGNLLAEIGRGRMATGVD